MDSQRLLAAANMVGKAETLYDIGTDHGFLPIELLLRGDIERACFCDVSAASLEKARRGALAAGLGEKARFVVTDGLEGLAPRGGDAVSICGMGGDSILSILSRAPVLPCRLVAQPNVPRAAFRLGLNALGYAVVDEELVFENGRYYAVLAAVKGEQRLTPAQALIGPSLLEKRPDILYRYIDRQIAVFKKACEAGGGGAERRCEAELRIYQEVRKWLQKYRTS